ncbi:exodeoxyribonuclease III [Akkermansia sp. N21116]|jgi:exodeoxyribonuclease-3|uniref:exodeoxyribonuclease III n=1 Tax=Akkermansia sp. N21116 TaxID=3040764 RepID=UPI00244EB8E9|nr:exodeoxyribonuclease III [Akkermansia sp. N21116]WPX41414.1 exodeoxyribonuclease III [Akkermansia sp. N21116]
MKLVSWNVNGLRATLGKGLPEAVDSLQPDIVCFQEIKARPEQVADLWLAAWPHQLWNPAEKPGYSGVLTLSRIAPLAVTTGIGWPDHDREGRVCTMEFERFYLVNCYTPNSQNELARLPYRQEWDEAFRKYVVALAGKKPVVFCGDLNVAHEEIDIARPDTNHFSAGFSDEERADFTELLQSGFVDTFRALHPDARDEYSWWSYRGGARARNVGWRIDYFCVSQALMPCVKAASIHQNVMGSDHCPVSLELD